MNLLIVDDHPTNLKLLHAQLEAEGHAVFEAHDGVDALAGLESESIDVVITDILMPRMDGYRLCHEIRMSDRLHNLPVIIYTSTYTSPSDEKLALDVGANKYLAKPASLETLVGALHEVMTQPRPAPRAVALREVEVLKEYSEQLVAKLEEKNTELMAADEKLRQLLAHSPAVIYTLKLDGQTITPTVVSENMEAVLGIPAAETARDGWWLERLHPDDRDRVLATVTKGLTGGGYSMEYRLRHKNGAYHWIEDNNRLMRDSAGEPREAVGVWTNITTRKRSADAMRESEHKYRRLFESLSDAAFLVDSEKWRIVDTNNQAETLLGLTRGEIIGMFLDQFPQPGASKDLHQRLSNGDTQAAPENYETEIVRKDKRVIPVLVSSAPVIFHGRKLIISLLRDISARKQTEEALHASEERFLELAENVNELFWMADSDLTQILYVSPAYEKIWGRSCQSLYEQPMSLAEAVHPADREQHMALLAKQKRGERTEAQYRIVRADGSLRWIRERCFPVRNQSGEVYRIAGVAEDITESSQA